MQLTESSPQIKNIVNPYVDMVKDYNQWVYFEEQAIALGGQWSEVIKPLQGPLHVEIGTGNGYHMVDYAQKNPNQAVIGFEIKYKELVQTIRRARNINLTNCWMIKADAKSFSNIFAFGEVEKVMIHFPDPWPKKRHHKNRLMKQDFLESLYGVMPIGGKIEFKTDHYDYFRWALREANKTSWLLKYFTEDLHQSSAAVTNYVTHFESIFLKKRQAIFYFELLKR